MQTKNLTLEEINAKFGDRVAIDLKDAIAAEVGSGSSPGKAVAHTKETEIVMGTLS